MPEGRRLGLGETHPVPATRCPACGRRVEEASGVTLGGEAIPGPSPGDLTVCIGCGALLAFADGLALRPMTDRDAAEADVDTLTRLLAARRAVLEVGKTRMTGRGA